MELSSLREPYCVPLLLLSTPKASKIHSNMMGSGMSGWEKKRAKPQNIKWSARLWNIWHLDTGSTLGKWTSAPVTRSSTDLTIPYIALAGSSPLMNSRSCLAILSPIANSRGKLQKDQRTVSLDSTACPTSQQICWSGKGKIDSCRGWNYCNAKLSL